MIWQFLTRRLRISIRIDSVRLLVDERKTMECFYCKKTEKLYELMTPLAKLKWSDVYLFNNQKYKGRCVITLKNHCDEIWELAEEQRNGFFKEVSLVAKAVSKVTGANKINYAVYGDIVSHFHVHIVPKKIDGYEWGGPFSDAEPDIRLSSDEFIDLKMAILNQARDLILTKEYAGVIID